MLTLLSRHLLRNRSLLFLTVNWCKVQEFGEQELREMAQGTKHPLSPIPTTLSPRLPHSFCL